MVTSSVRQPRNPFRMAAPTVDKNDPFAHAHPVVKFCYIGAVTILLVAVATLALSTMNNQTTVGSVTDTMVSHYYAAEKHLRTRGVATSTDGVNPKSEQPLIHPGRTPSSISSQSVPRTTQQQQQQRREGGGVQGQARVVVSGESNHHGDKELHMNPLPNGSSSDAEDDEQESIPDDEVDEDIVLDQQDMIILQQANAFGVNKKILGAAKEQVRKEIREANRNSDYMDFGLDDQKGAASETFRRQHQDDTVDTTKKLLQEQHVDMKDLKNANDHSGDLQQPSRDEDRSSSQHNVVKLIRRRGDTPVTILADTLNVNEMSDTEVDSIHDIESSHQLINISTDQAENDERPIVFTRNKRTSGFDAAAVTDTT